MHKKSYLIVLHQNFLVGVQCMLTKHPVWSTVGYDLPRLNAQQEEIVPEYQ